MIASALLLASSTTVAPYPASEMLAAFGDVCVSSASEITTYTESRPTQQAKVWRELALKQGWTEVTEVPAPGITWKENTVARTYYWAQALDYELFIPLAQLGGERITVQNLLRKQVAGREVFISIFAADADNPTLAECRLRDPLGDGVTKQPISRSEVEAWLGQPVERRRGWFGVDEYFWRTNSERKSLRIHFGFDPKPFATRGAKYDPYALYGMTLVRSEYDHIIVV